MPPVGFEPTILAGERPQTHALDRAATGTGIEDFRDTNFPFLVPIIRTLYINGFSYNN